MKVFSVVNGILTFTIKLLLPSEGKIVTLELPSGYWINSTLSGPKKHQGLSSYFFVKIEGSNLGAFMVKSKMWEYIVVTSDVYKLIPVKDVSFMHKCPGS